MQKQSPLDAPSELFASLHPGLAALESAIGEQIKAIATGSSNASWAQRALQAANPTSWSSRIEAARNNPEELAKLRVLYDEAALSALGAYLNWQAPLSYSPRKVGVISILDAIANAIIAHDDIEKRCEHEWLKPIFKARIKMAATLHCSSTGEVPDVRMNDAFIGRLQKIQVESFKAFLLTLKAMPAGWYPTEPAVSRREIQPFSNSDVDLRSLPVVHFVDCFNSTHPASESLAGLLEQCDQSMRAGWENHKLLKGDQNGRVNERQHAGRLLDFLHSEGTPHAAYHCGGTLDQQVKAQDERRYEYETYCHLLLASVHKFRKLIEQTIETLKASAKEGEDLLAEMEAEKHNSIDRTLTLAIIINNCLCADVSLRRWMRESAAFQKALDNDLSRGAGRRVLEAAFQEVHNTYKHSVSTRRDELAGKRRSCGSSDYA